MPKNTPDMAQLNDGKAHEPSLNSEPGCIKVVDTFRHARTYGENRRNFVGQSFWARGYFVSTVGRDEEVIRNYIRNQEEEDKRLEQMNLWR
jgi:putative transposase